MAAREGAGAAQPEPAARGRRTLNQDDWDRHPWSRTFDLISAEYGLTDEQILELRPTRLQSMVRSIHFRREAEFRRNTDLLTVAVRRVVAAVPAAGGNKSGAKNADKVKLVEPEPTVADLMPKPEVSTETALRLFGQPLIPMED